ncbi:MAG: stage III sporulation protein AE [Clostridia bacterium]|nr:stage III sporulation protein AE [Clostridia bacterium]
MKRFVCLVMLLLLFPVLAHGETLPESVDALLGTLQLEKLDEAARECGWFDGDIRELLKALASGKMVLSASDVLSLLFEKAAGVFSRSVWRMTRLLVPALLVSAAEWIQTGHGTAAKAARYAGLIMTMALLTSDLREHVELASETVDKMADWMQAIFPLLVTLLAAVGGTASSAFYQPAVIAAGGAMTTLIHQVTLPLAVSVAVLTMVGGISEGMRVSRLCRLLRQAANWTLGFGFTVFIGVMSVQGVSAAAVDGVSIRTAKYAIDNFIPIVGGMFSDTVDTLVGCSLVVHNAVGVFGLLLLLGALLMPLMRTVLTLFLYRAAAALIEPLSDSPLCRAIGGYADVFSLLFIIQLSVGAMFLMLVAQLITAGNLTVMLR